MTNHLRARLPDLLGAALAIALGLYAYVESRGYEMGDLRAMGPGYFPRAISFGLIGLGVLLAITTLRGEATRFGDDRPPLSSILLIGASLLAFALLVERNGMGPAIFAAVFLSTFASENRNIPRSLLLAAITALVCVGLFIYGLGLPIKAFSL